MKKIVKGVLFISLFYSIFYYLVIDGYIVENVREKYSILFDEIQGIEAIDYYSDGEDSYAPVYEDEDQALIDEANGYIAQAKEPFHTIWFITSGLSFIALYLYGKELIRNPLYLRLAFSLYLSSTFFGLTNNFTEFRFIVFSMILYFLIRLFKLSKLNNSKESSTMYIFTYVAIAILFNPFMQFHFSRETWLFIDLFTIVIVLIEPFLLKTYFNNEKDVKREIKEENPGHYFDL